MTAAKQQTYSLLGPRAEPPSEYELVTSRLLPYVGRGFEVNVPLRKWYQEHQEASPFRCRDWEAFAAPRETTYTKYTQIQRAREEVVSTLLESIDADGYDRRLARPWLEVLSRVLAPFRYLGQGMHMVASYVGQMAPAGRVVIAALFQAADEMRRIERIAYRMRQLQSAWPDFGRDSRELWQRAPEWQPAREAIERLLVAYDWGEALVGLEVCLKPLVDEVMLRFLAGSARESGDPRLAEILQSLSLDSAWHREWSGLLIRMAMADNAGSRDAVQRWTERWSPLAVRAAESILAMFAEGARAELQRFYAEHLRNQGHVTSTCPWEVHQ